MSGDDGNRYEYPNGVLRNKLGIKDAEELKRMEAALTLLRLGELEQHPITGSFDLDHLKAIHRHIFQDVYDWAGELREVDIVKEHTRFAHFRFLDSNAQTLFSHLASEKHLRNLTEEHFVVRAAYYLGELNALHPFREGNGRVQRVFLSAIAYAANFDLAWERVSPEKMIAASVASLFQANNSEFEQIPRSIVLPLPSSREGHS